MILRFAGDRYVVTGSDHLWLLRAVHAEGPTHAEVARALVNLFCYLRSRGDSRTLAEVVRAYAQPVNPRWFPGGDLLARELARTTDPDARRVIEQRAAYRPQHAKRLRFSVTATRAVDRALNESNLTDVTDYAAPEIDASKKGYIARSPPKAGVNRLWTRAVGWTGYVVEGSAIVIVLLAVVAGVAWHLHRGGSWPT